MTDNGNHFVSTAKEITERAANWIELRMRDTWCAEDEEALQYWLNAAPAHRIAFWRLEVAWGETSRLTALRQPISSALPHPWNGVTAIISKAIAAALVIAMLGYMSASYFKQGDVTYSTGLGERKTLALSDGSRIELNTNTTLRIAFAGSGRKVWLDRGEVYFNVHHDAEHPFEVIAEGQRIADLGTQFNVRADGKRLNVAVLQGRVSFDVKGGSAPAELVPGDVAVAEAGKLSLMRASASDLIDRLSWRSGKLKFHHTPLAQVAHEFNRYSGKKVVISGAAAGDLTINGTFATNVMQAFARIAQEILGLKVDDQGSKIVISH